ncbi:MAG TPA: hypothetical protein VKH45_07785 [Candidatus Acidoferrum sp.]|nr:hypothetical protein [Candidatus Acidoferrum sp.]
MPGPIFLIIWVVGTAFELSFVICSFLRKSFLQYLFLNLYLLFSVVGSVARFGVLTHYGQDSDQYMYCYYYTDLVLTLTLFVALLSLYMRVFSELKVKQFLYFVAMVVLLGTAFFSYAVVNQTSDRLSTSFAYELSQNLYFVGLILTYILWGAVMKLRETRTRVVQFVLSLGIYFSAYAACYAMVTMSEKPGVTQYLSPLLGCLLPLSWTITLMRYSEESRLATAHLVAVQR